MQTSQDYDRMGLLGRALVLLALALVAVGITACLALVDQDTTYGRLDLEKTAFGMPFDWLEQDQTSLDPSFPFTAKPQRPEDYPSEIRIENFLADVGIVLAGEVLILGVWFQLRRRSRQPF